MKHGNLLCRVIAAVTLVLFIIGWVWLAVGSVYNTADRGNLGLRRRSSETNTELLSYSVTSIEEYHTSVPGLKYESRLNPADATLLKSPAIFNLVDILQDWPPDETRPEQWINSKAHPNRGDGIRRFNFCNQQEMNLAFKYRDAEIPFVVYNVPAMQLALQNFTPEALMRNFGSVPREIEKSHNNHFMYYKAKKNQQAEYPEWIPPQLEVPMTFSKFLETAAQAQARTTAAGDQSLAYLTINAGEGSRTDWIVKALPFFTAATSSSPDSNLFIVHADELNGINCRFGMRGVIAEAHYDGHLNFVAMIRGRKRYILLPPSECSHMHLLPRGHPSGRHSSVDWSDISHLHDLDPDFLFAKSTEVVLSAGEVLYIPSYWIHYIISQDASIQCNSRSGVSSKGVEYIDACTMKG